MNALAELRKRASTAAIPAIPAIRGSQRAPESRESQESQGVKAETRFSAPAPATPTNTLRAHLLALATAEGFDANHVHRLHDLDIAECAGLSDPQLVGYLRLLTDSSDRRAGRVPVADTAAMYCRGCGPVWIHPTIAAVLPVVNGWPHALGCPWCFVRNKGGTIPRPPVTCRGCAHFITDTINPEAGIGGCSAGKGAHWPMQRHPCGTHSPNTGDIRL